jgi:class 3 adenylate cyclase/pimeloyl-ACP methyl ester carboxylesterase
VSARPQIQYTTTDHGVSIAYCVEGEGSPLVACPHIFESFSLDYLFPDLHSIRRATQAGHRVVRYDARGTGLSQREVEDVSHEAFVRDLEAVVRAAGMERFALVATGFSGAVGIDYATRHPGVVDRLVLWGANARSEDILPEDALRGWAEFARTNWQLAAQTLADADPGTRSELPNADVVGFGEMLRQSMTGEMAAKIVLQQLLTYDVRALLAQVAVPTLVIEREPSILRGQAIAAGIPGARLFVRQGGTSSFVFANARAGIDAIRSFLGDDAAEAPVAGVPSPASVRTILFTDIVGHTEMMQRLGDTKGRDVLREHERITRETLKQHGGAEVKTMGDGFMASFGSVTSALDCAIALQRAFAAHTGSMPEPLHVRVGLNAGEPIEEDGDLFGATVILASRIAAKAGAGEILIPEPVRHLLSGKSFVFSDRGEFAMKGFDDAVRLYEVRWLPTVAAGDEDA